MTLGIVVVPVEVVLVRLEGEARDLIILQTEVVQLGLIRQYAILQCLPLRRRIIPRIEEELLVTLRETTIQILFFDRRHAVPPLIQPPRGIDQRQSF